jgi:hypothetical protein
VASPHFEQVIHWGAVMASCDLRCRVFRFDVRLCGTGIALLNPTFQLESLIHMSIYVNNAHTPGYNAGSFSFFQGVAGRKSIRFYSMPEYAANGRSGGYLT